MFRWVTWFIGKRTDYSIVMSQGKRRIYIHERIQKEVTRNKKNFNNNCQVPLAFKLFFFFASITTKKDFSKEVVEETPLLETLKTRWSKALENIHAGLILHWVKAKEPDHCSLRFESLAQQSLENKDLLFSELFLNFLAPPVLWQHCVDLCQGRRLRDCLFTRASFLLTLSVANLSAFLPAPEGMPCALGCGNVPVQWFFRAPGVSQFLC